MIKTKQFQGQSVSISPNLTDGTWSFGPKDGPFLTQSMTLNLSGRVNGYLNKNVWSWRIEKHSLLMLKEDGNLALRSVELFKDQNDLLTFFLEDPNDTTNHFILKKNIIQAQALKLEEKTDAILNEGLSEQNSIEEKIYSLQNSHFFTFLNCEISFTQIFSIDHPECHLILDLTNKNYQFNTSKENWSIANLAKLLDQGGSILAFNVKDTFTNYGVAGCLYLKGNTILRVVISNSVLGMGLEDFIILEAIQQIISGHPHSVEIFANLHETPEAKIYRELYLRLGFHEIENTPDTLRFILNSNTLPRQLNHIKKINK